MGICTLHPSGNDCQTHCFMTDWLTEAAIEQLLDGLMVTVLITVVTSILSLGLGVILGTLRISSRRGLSIAAGAWIEVFRNVPALVQIIFWAFAFPSVFSVTTRQDIFFDNDIWEIFGSASGLAVPYYAVAACAGLTLNTSAHLAEIYRAGVGTIAVEQVEGARTLGAGRLHVWRSIIVPGGLRGASPAISTRMIHNMKNTSLVSFVAVPDLFNAMQGAITESFRATEFLLLVAGAYLALAAAMTMILDLADNALHRGRPHV